MIFLKVVVASTEEQESHIEELVAQMYTGIFPMYFSDEEIEELHEQAVLRPRTEDSAYNGTLKEAFQIISSLQALIALLENLNDSDRKIYRSMFERNTRILNEYGYFFPFSFDQFIAATYREGMFSQYVKPANQFLI
ncbi:DUF5365 family protein [Metabacillus herbersteinensis]|uniref:DUF5365 family protein n=1 Tax=Metabacillus herbersteinensis TaxID=283816 RepID=A0ABV6GER8_9BACI